MARVISALNWIFVKILTWLNYISVVLIFIMAVWIFGDVVGRFFFNQPIPGTTELVKTAILGIVFLGVAYTLHREGHIRTTVLIKRLPPKAAAAIEAAGALIGIIIFSLMVYYGWEAAMKAFAVKEFEGVQLRVPTYPSRFIMVLGSALLVIQYFINLIKHLQVLFGLKRGETL